MSDQSMPEFFHERERLNDLVMVYGGKEIKRFFSLDGQVYSEGALSVQTKEIIGLVASLVLRCDDCIRYHIQRCYDCQVSDDQLQEALGIGLVVGGSITIPHLRRAFDAWDQLKKGADQGTRSKVEGT